MTEDCQTNAYPSERVLYTPKSYTVNLDLDPSDRWTEIGKAYGKDVKKILKTVVHVVNQINDKIVPFILKVCIIDTIFLHKSRLKTYMYKYNLEFARSC